MIRLQPAQVLDRAVSSDGAVVGTPNTPAAASTARNSRSIGPFSHTVSPELRFA